jgi:hypothetical protein
VARSPEGRQRRKADVRQRAKALSTTARSRCSVFGCSLPTMMAEGRGLSNARCRYHVQHEARHGSVWKKTYSAKQLAPFRATARKWIIDNRHLNSVEQSRRQFEVLLQGAGQSESALRLRGLKPQERARIAIARLRDANVTAAKLLEVVLAVNMILKEDPVTDRSKDYRLCQIAKPCQRMASSTHKRWNTTEIHAYPKSSGQVLRHLGAKLEVCAEWLVAGHLTEILAAKVKAHGRYQPPEAMPSIPLPNPQFKQPRKKPPAHMTSDGKRR